MSVVEEAAGFGGRGGPAISNRDSILANLDAALGQKGPPAVEYLFVCPYASTKILGIGFGSPFGHAVVRYTLPDGTQKVMNIVKNRNQDRLVNFVDPTEYLYGTAFEAVGAAQGGAYNRRIIGVRIEKWDDELLQDLDYYYRKLARREESHSATFELFLGPLWNFLRDKLPEGFNFAESGNCARWTSAGLVFADLMQSRNIWPKRIWIDLFEKHGLKDPSNVHVVVYEHIAHAEQSFGDGRPLWSEGASPFSFIQDVSYFDLTSFAHATIVVPPGEVTAEIVINEKPCAPSFWRWRKTEVIGSVLVAGWLLRGVYRYWGAAKRDGHQSAPTAVVGPGDVRKIVQQRRMLRLARAFFRGK